MHTHMYKYEHTDTHIPTHALHTHKHIHIRTMCIHACSTAEPFAHIHKDLCSFPRGDFQTSKANHFTKMKIKARTGAGSCFEHSLQSAPTPLKKNQRTSTCQSRIYQALGDSSKAEGGWGEPEKYAKHSQRELEARN